MSIAAPDYLDPVVGWRTWFVVSDDARPSLASIVFPTIWPRRRELVADCRRRGRSFSRPWRNGLPGHGAPSEQCECGIYGAAGPRRALDYPGLCGASARDHAGRPVLHWVVGEVALWGAVVECGHGWRGALAYPRRIYVPPRRAGKELQPAGRLALELAGYGVPVQLLETDRREEICDALGRVGVA